MTKTKPHLYRKYGKSFYKLLSKHIVRQLPIASEEKQKDKYTSEEIKKFLIQAMISPGKSLEDESVRRKTYMQTPTSQTMIRRLKRGETEAIRQEVNVFLSKKFYCIQRRYRKKTIFLAVDAHDEPYYGKKMDWTCGGRRKQSTTTFTRVIALYIVHPGRPLLVALSPMKGSEAETAILLIQELQQWFLTGQRIVFLGDGKYYHVGLLTALHTYGWDYIVRGYYAGELKKHCLALEQQGKEGEGYTFRHRIRTGYSLNRRYITTRGVIYYSRDGANPWVTSLAHYSASRVVQWYKRRFRIENAFRDMRPLLLRTCSHNACVRFQLLWSALILHTLLHYLLLTLIPLAIWNRNLFAPCPLEQHQVYHHSYLFYCRTLFALEEVRW